MAVPNRSKEVKAIAAKYPQAFGPPDATIDARRRLLIPIIVRELNKLDGDQWFLLNRLDRQDDESETRTPHVGRHRLGTDERARRCTVGVRCDVGRASTDHGSGMEVGARVELAELGRREPTHLVRICGPTRIRSRFRCHRTWKKSSIASCSC